MIGFDWPAVKSDPGFVFGKIPIDQTVGNAAIQIWMEDRGLSNYD